MPFLVLKVSGTGSDQLCEEPQGKSLGLVGRYNPMNLVICKGICIGEQRAQSLIANNIARKAT